MPKKILNITFLIIAIAVGFGGGFIFGKATTSENGIFGITKELQGLERILSNEPTFDLLSEGVAIIKTKYVDSGDITEKELIYGAMDGILRALGDPYSVFFPPPDAKIFKEDVGGAFEGIGAEIGIRDKVLTVISPLKDSPAEKAGLKAGDIILYVDDTETKDLSLDGAVQIIRGPKGTEVVLTVTRDGEDEDLKISIIRDKIKIPNLKWELKGEDRDIAYIALYHFTENASDDFRDIAREVLDSSAKKIILDLRNNPGGYLEVAVDIAGWFLDPDLLVVTEDHKGKAENKIYTTYGSAALSGYPLVILINGGSASASEILAGALRDHKNIKLVGETTFGKGSVQELANLSDKSSIKITVAKWLTPNGISIEDNGLEPDVIIEMTSKIYEEHGDVQIEKAIEVVNLL